MSVVDEKSVYVPDNTLDPRGARKANRRRPSEPDGAKRCFVHLSHVSKGMISAERWDFTHSVAAWHQFVGESNVNRREPQVEPSGQHPHVESKLERDTNPDMSDSSTRLAQDQAP